MEFEFSKKNFLFFVTLIFIFLLAGVFYFSGYAEEFLEKSEAKTITNFSGDYSKQKEYDSNLRERFLSLSSAETNFCAGPNILSLTDALRLQGSCCSAMDFHRYTEQIEGLKKYSFINKIPQDPYDIDISLAEELLGFQSSIFLSPLQQSVYDDAVKLSHEGGPCCCKCWRWYAFEGLAKYLITEHGFNSNQVAEVWDLEDGCGGQGHIDGMHV